MVRLLVKLAIVALIATAGWRLGAEYLTHYRFREAVRAATVTHQSEEELRRVILEEAQRFGIPLADDALAIRLDDRRAVVTGSYVKTVELVPGFRRPWTFDWAVETFPPISSGPR
jgi:hypothetical protein